MRGAIAAGHPLTADAGARVLRDGGTAVDACVAAAFVSWVCESPLAGPGGGGFMLVHEAGGRTVVLDCFVSVPREANEAAGLLELAVDYDGDTRQIFRTGPAAVAVPGTALGLEEAHRRWGRMPWAELAAPAAALARDGFELTATQAYLHEILDPLLRHSPEGDAMYGRGGRAYREGELFAIPDLAETLDRLGVEGASVVYDGELAGRIVEHVRRGGGALALEDLREYDVIEREPVSVEYRGYELRTNPPPSAGGVLIALGLQALG
jgi:gamma-glutamyltranspeptidase/glutathione hydrolase